MRAPETGSRETIEPYPLERLSGQPLLDNDRLRGSRGQPLIGFLGKFFELVGLRS